MTRETVVWRNRGVATEETQGTKPMTRIDMIHIDTLVLIT